MTRRGVAILPLLAAMLAIAGAASAQSSSAEKDSLLQLLVGDWSMTGDVRGKPVEYRMDARRTLNGRYVEMHMIDVARPPAYEARVFLGVDPNQNRYIVHWLDSSGAAYSIPHGLGTANGDTIRFEFRYADGPFRDQFAFDRRSHEWRFRLESGDSTGVWRSFADYRVKRR